jgi:D-alanyl-D-alanine dipeptidase
MIAEGFIPYFEEWWHFDDPEWENYPILDISFDALQ